MTTPAPDGFRPEWLAGYADGELDPVARAIVERWLIAHPGARDELTAQRELSLANGPFWEKAEPPEPSAATWAAVRRGIGAELDADSPDPGRRPGWRVAAWALAGLTAAAAVAWLAFAPPAPQPRPPTPKPVEVVKRPAPDVAPMPRPRGRPPAAELAALSMATDDDVILDRVPEFPAGWLPVGVHPLAGVMSLASEEELQVAEVVPGPAWLTGTGGPKMTTAPGDAPMIYAAKPR